MKPGLKRIEATLDQLSMPSSSSNELAAVNPATRPKKDRKKTAQQEAATRPLQAFPLPEKGSEPPLAEAPPSNQVSGKNQVANQSVNQAISSPVRVTKVKRPPTSKRSGTRTESSKIDTVQPFPAQENCPNTPPLPKSKPLSFSSHRHATNPNLAMGLLKEVEAIVAVWQQELEEVVQQIQTLYQEGPIVDGWLESQSYEPQLAFQSVGTATLRHAEIEHLMEYVEQICSVQPSNGQPSNGQQTQGVTQSQSATQRTDEQSRAGYRLCGLDADGQLWSRPCPPQQVPYVGLAIARYQKLRIFLGKKQGLENRLHHLVRTLTLLHGQLQEPL